MVSLAARLYRATPTPASFTPRVGAFTPAVRGYAPQSASPATAAVKSAGTSKAAAAKSTGTSKSTATKSSSTTTTISAKDLAFLDDKKLSIEEKLFRFMTLVMQKSDQALADEMKNYEAKRVASTLSSSASSPSYASAASSSASSSGSKVVTNPIPVEKSTGGGGLFGFLGDALSGAGDMVVHGAEALAKDLGGPVLAGVATAVGMPFLAPVALQIGGDLGVGLVDGLAAMAGLHGATTSARAVAAPQSESTTATATKSTTATATKSSSSSTSKTAATGEGFDEKLEMFKLQRLVEQQNAMFSALSNVLRSVHDAQMTAVNNIR